MVPNTLEKVYIAFSGSGDEKNTAELMLCLRSLLAEIADFDPISGETLPTDAVTIIDKITLLHKEETAYHKDRVFRILDHTSAAVRHIAENMRSKIVRMHEIMPVYAVREMDSASIQWLARKTGRTLREKLSGRPYLKAVVRKESFDTAENRLFKAYLQKLDEILTVREDTIKDEADIHLLIQRWIRADIFQSIGPWINISPNNILLQDKNYRKTWDGWNLLQRLDDSINGDYERIQQDFITVLFWETLSLMSLNRHFRLLQMPIKIDYDRYSFFGFENTDKNSFSVKGFLIAGNNVKDSRINPYNGEFEISLKFADKRSGIKIVFASGVSIFINYTQDKFWIFDKNSKNLINPVPGNRFDDIRKISKDVVTHILGSKTVINEEKHLKTEYGNVKNNNAAIDLYNVKPKFITRENIVGQIPYALLLQHWEGNITVNCSRAAALQFAPGIKTLSIRNLFFNDATFTQADKNKAAMELTRRLKESLKVNTISYLTPDWADDFDLENIRRGMNFHFEEAYSMPQSIAVVSYYFDTIKNGKNRFDINTIFLILDTTEKRITITPIMGNQLPELEKRVPETKGIIWERHPTIFMDIANQTTDENDLVSNMYKIFGKEFISDQTNILSIYENKKWHHLPEESNILLKAQKKISLPFKKIKEDLFKNEMFRQDQPIEFLALDDTVSFGQTKNNLISTENLLSGTMILSERQKSAGNIPLWKDHLPELSIKNNAGTYNLVGKNTPPIVPERGKKVNIPVSGFVSLPAGVNYIHFQLIQGRGSNISKYFAFLESPAFPLKEEVPCDFLLTYTYGDAEPYNLQFRAKKPAAAGFTSIEVQWRTKDELPEPELKTPQFPEPKTWEDFKKWPDKKGEGTKNLLEWCTYKLEVLEELAAFDIEHEIKRMISQRKTGMYKSQKKQADYFFVVVDNYDVYCHKDQFYEPYDPSLCCEGALFSMEIRQGERSLYGINITYSDITPDIMVKKIFDRKMEETEKLFRSKRFPLLTIWNNGHSLTENDAPQEFRESMLRACNAILYIIEMRKINPELNDEFLFFFSCIHKDMPIVIVKMLLQFTKNIDDYRKYARDIAYAIGDASLEWQQILFEQVINNLSNENMVYTSLRVLSTAFWRNEKLIYKLDNRKVLEMGNIIKRHLNEIIGNNTMNIIKCNILNRHFMLLLALLRKRNPENKILHPRSDTSEYFVEQLDRVIKLLENSAYKIPSYMEFNIENPKKEAGVPDIIYALRQYLTGDDAANTIKISGIDFGDDNE